MLCLILTTVALTVLLARSYSICLEYILLKTRDLCLLSSL